LLLVFTSREVIDLLIDEEFVVTPAAFCAKKNAGRMAIEEQQRRNFDHRPFF